MHPEYAHHHLTDADIMERVQGLSPEDLETAWQYCERNREEIDRTI